MKFRKLTRVSIGLALGCTALGAHADEELPAVHTLPCETACANSVGATGISQRLPEWPQKFLASIETYVEGYVRLHYKINTDGHVSDISVVSTVGPKEFEEITVKAVQDWVYKPASLDGKPVATCRTMVMRFKMTIDKGKAGARPEISQAYGNALRSIKSEKLDDAKAMLAEALSRPKLNLYERGMLANLSSFIAFKKADYLEAHRLSSEAIDFTSQDLPSSVRRELLETRIKSALMLKDIVDAQEAEDKLKNTDGFDESDPVFALVEDVKSQADGMPQLSVTGRIPEASQGAGTYIGLFRRNFGFYDIKGSLSGFSLTCKQQAIESKVSETAKWQVPKSWSDCRVLVRGAPGTTFKLAQLTD